MLIWIHISELKETVVIGDNTYAPSDDPKDCKPMPQELIDYLESKKPKVEEVPAAPEVQAAPAPEPTKKG